MFRKLLGKSSKRKVISIVLTLSMLLTLAPAAGFAADEISTTNTVSFSDVASDSWYKPAVDYVTQHELLIGVSDELFAPEQDVTRAMVVTVLWRQSGSPANDGTSAFKDVPSDQWYAQAVAWAAKEGIASGYDADTFGPNDSVTREQLVTFMYRYTEYSGGDISITDYNVLDRYADGDQVFDWARTPVIWALQNKVISGVSSTSLAAADTANRAQYAVILMNMGATLPGDTDDGDDDNNPDNPSDNPVIPSGGGGSSSSNKDVYDLSEYDAVSYYHNGTIITVDEENGEDEDGNPIYAQAVLTGDGEIIAVAYDRTELRKIERSVKAAEDVEIEDVDLDGETMIPAFLDAHSHMDMVDQFADASPSSGVTSLETLVEKGQQDFDAWLNDHTYDDEYGEIAPNGQYWFATNGFDNTAFLEDNYAMPTKETLDQISTEYPVVYIHASSHLGVVNSVGLAILQQYMGYSQALAAYANPETNWDKDEDGSYNGIIRESGFYVLNPMGFLWVSESNRTASASGIIENAMDIYASNGITTAILGGGGGDRTALMQGISEDERIIDVTSLLADGTLASEDATADQEYTEDGWKYGAVKLFLDGSPQGKTAWFDKDYTDPSGGGYYRDGNETLLDSEDLWWWGEEEGKKVSESDLVDKMTYMMSKGIAFHCHANGTGAIQEYIDAYRQALINNGVDINDEEAVKAMQDKVRAVIIHGQTATQSQLEECNELGINISFFTDHVYYYGDYHMYSTVGPDRGQRISPMADALADDMDINITMHQDSPVAPPNMLFSIFNASNRITRDGQAIGRGSADGSSDNDSRILDWTNKAYDTKDERISAYEALKCVTINSAWQNFEEDEKGSITVGKQADFVILNVNLLTDEFLELTPLEAQNGKFVERTINDDVVVYEK